MKKIFAIMALMLSSIATFAADFQFTVPTATVNAGHTATAEFALENVEAVAGYQFNITLPTGLTLSDFSVDGCRTNSAWTKNFYDKTGGLYTVQCYTSNAAAEAIAAGTGVIFTLTLTCDASVTPGDYTGLIDAMQITKYTGTSLLQVDDAVGGDFTITVLENMVDLYDTDTALPATASYEKAVIHRNFKANVWNSFVAPFGITEAQYKAAFGDDVQVAKFSSQNISDPDTEIVIGFTTVTETDANTPVIVMPSADLTQVTFTGTIDVEAEDEPAVQVGKKAAEKSFAYGTYVPKTIKADGDEWSFPLYLKDNKFYYAPAAGVTIKGYRAYFVIAESLTAYNSQYEVRMAIDEDPTAISSIDADYENGMTYTVDGKFVGKDVDLKRMQKGVYIVNGKKVINK